MFRNIKSISYSWGINCWTDGLKIKERYDWIRSLAVIKGDSDSESKIKTFKIRWLWHHCCRMLTTLKREDCLNWWNSKTEGNQMKSWANA